MQHRRAFISTAATLLLAAAGDPFAHADCTHLPEPKAVERLDQRTRESNSYPQDELLRQFVLFSYRDIANDLVDGRGIYLATTGSFFRPVCEDETATTKWLRELLIASPTAPDFARRLAVAHALLFEDAPLSN